MKPLVSILIPAYNAEETLAETIRSAIAQTWPRKQIIVVNDGSTDRTQEIAESFAPAVTVLSTENRGLCGACNYGLKFCEGDYIQELDSDDLLVPDKIERQLSALRPGDGKRLLLASPWAPFYYRTRNAHFVNTSLCQDLSPAEWLIRKFSDNVHMQNATWLVSRELVEAAGPWNTSLCYDQDGEYFARVLITSEGTRFISGPAVYYRMSGLNRISRLGKSRKKRESLLLSMRLQIQYLRSLEDSQRVRSACMTFLQNWYGELVASPPHILAEIDAIAADLGGAMRRPALGWKYAWIGRLFGQPAGQWAQREIPNLKYSTARQWDLAMFTLESRRQASHHAATAPPRSGDAPGNPPAAAQLGSADRGSRG